MPALQVGGNLAGAALNAYSRRPIVVQQPQQQPSAPPPITVTRGRGRGRGRPTRRSRGTGRSGPEPPVGGAGSGMLVVQDTEMFVPQANKLVTIQFNPSSSEVPRLQRIEDMYERFRILYINIKFVPATSSYTTGSLYCGLNPGPANTAVKTSADIVKMRPSRCVAVWQPATIGVGQTIDSQRYMHCGDLTRDGIAFSFYYYFGNAEASGHFQVSYKVEFAYPKVF